GADDAAPVRREEHLHRFTGACVVLDDEDGVWVRPRGFGRHGIDVMAFSRVDGDRTVSSRLSGYGFISYAPFSAYTCPSHTRAYRAASTTGLRIIFKQ